MSAIVLDCSATMAWCFEDEASPAGDALLDRVAATGALVPALWRWEVANVLVMASRRGRLTQADVAARLFFLDALPIAIDPQSADAAWHEVALVAQAQKLTVYDAAYLELAARTGLPLATNDSELTAAAAALGVTIVS